MNKTTYAINCTENGNCGSAPTLYAACKAIAGHATRFVVSPDGRCVAHWHEGLRPMFGATLEEREQIAIDAGIVASFAA